MSADKALDYDETANEKFQKLQSTWAPAEKNYKDADLFFKDYSKNISQIAAILDDLQTFNNDESERLTLQMEESRVQSKKDEEFHKNAEDYIHSKTEELAKSIKHFDALKAKMKEILNNLSAKKMSALKVNENPELNNFFSTIFEIFYREKKEAFEWSKFKSYAIVKDKCDDFSVRLSTYDFISLNEDQLARLEQIKQNKSILDMINQDKNAENLLDILDYLEYVPEAVKTAQAIDELERGVKKIKNEDPIREVRAKALKNKVEVIKGDLKFLEENDQKFSKYVNEFADHLKQFDRISEAYRNHRNQLNEKVISKYNEVQSVPKSIYA